ncbi:peptide methionine sulfoxide reductase MsrA 2-like [Clavelina lepadiformis]|uniref:peptide-methionine (S)-S-oxide reductase n=1 Tax=Clavelina lepadiformis TaxID=159417 RepID=A0ABP0EYU6_CLALP
MRVGIRDLMLLVALPRYLVMGGNYSTKMVSKEEAIRGRSQALNWTHDKKCLHHVNKNSIFPPFPDDTELAMFGMGCFWGAEKKFWQTNGVYSTQVGYSGGFTENPTYREVCDGKTGHTEVIRVIYYPNKVSYEKLLKVFWESHNPCQGMRQGNDVGTQYRSGIYYYNDAQKQLAEASRETYQKELEGKSFGNITTEIKKAAEFFYAEDYHQQYLSKNPGGYCGMGGTGVSCPIGLGLGKKDEL